MASERETIASPHESPRQATSPSESEFDAPKSQENEEIEELEVVPRNTLLVEISTPSAVQRHLYQTFPEEITVTDVLRTLGNREEEAWYAVAFEDGHKEELSSTALLQLTNGRNALNVFQQEQDKESDSSSVKFRRREQLSALRAMVPKLRKRPRGQGNIVERSDSDDSSQLQPSKKLRSSNRASTLLRNARATARASSPEGDSDEHNSRSIARTRKLRSRTTRSSGVTSPLLSSNVGVEDELVEDGQDSDGSDIVYQQPQKSKVIRAGARSRGKQRLGRLGRAKAGRLIESEFDEAAPSRRSGRATGRINMRERGEDEEMFADEDKTEKGPATVSVRETFQELPVANAFRSSHNQQCDVCAGHGKQSNKGISPLIYCQGCTSSIHKACLGLRTAREHIVTKIGEGNFVMQCRRCVGVARRKDELAPALGSCTGCDRPGVVPFSSKKTTKQEEKLRLENGGVDPIWEVDSDLVNSAYGLLFRCTACSRGFHFDHLPYDEEDEIDRNEAPHGKTLFKEYSKDFMCLHCRTAPGKVQTIVAWRPKDLTTYDSNKDSYFTTSEDDKEYLIKWLNLSYFKCTWMPGAWVWGSTQVSTRKAFIRRDEESSLQPITTIVAAIPEEYLRMEIVLDVKYNSGQVKVNTEAVDRARISEVDQVLVKFEGLSYEEAVWESPPLPGRHGPNESERWKAFKSAYNEFVTGKYFKQAYRPESRIAEYRAQNFEKRHLLANQPTSLTGGIMKEYQLEGLNYILYKFHQQKNCILADEMGLGKTIQIIATIAALVEKPKCWPFLIVVPNSTCPNWRREIKKWAPALRVVAYYGLKEARDMAMKYELYPGGCNDMRAHIVVTSFDAPTDDHSRSFFKKIKWAGLFVDEGQRLKNEKNQLYVALTALNVPFRVLLTGTPLQNNKRELFNLLHFIDNSLDAETLDEKYEELTQENLSELHDLIRPFFLRRTKLQVLKDLPPMAQIIIPISMSTLQKQLYRTILEKSPELIRSLFIKDSNKLRAGERGSLNNILMQLRKVLCHPYLYSRAVEDRHAGNHENVEIGRKIQKEMVEASAKLQLFDLLLPKLKERGHRVLIFSQFLGMLDIVEDFLIGLGLGYRRLDGSIGTIEKQKRIDEYNQPDSDLFAFLLSTRAGGVGINLATADTVIIMDPDFNPHQDMQALSRAHRIGQKKKVLVFQLMTKQSAEEKIVQIGRKKMALDHVLIEALDGEDDVGADLTSVLAHGAQALFDKDDSQDIHYDSASIDKLIDRSQVETTNSDESKSGESQFSYARIWTNDKSGLADDLADEDEPLPDPGIWDKILKEREEAAAIEAAKRQTTFGRGKRQRGTVNYKGKNGTEIYEAGEHLMDDLPIKPDGKRNKPDQDSETDFVGPAYSDGDDSDGAASRIDPGELWDTRKGMLKIFNTALSSKPGLPTMSSRGIMAAPKPVALKKKPVKSTRQVTIPLSTKAKASGFAKPPVTVGVPHTVAGYGFPLPLTVVGPYSLAYMYSAWLALSDSQKSQLLRKMPKTAFTDTQVSSLPYA